MSQEMNGLKSVVRIETSKPAQLNDKDKVNELHKLATSCEEAKVIFFNFANRKRTHKDTILNIRPFFVNLGERSGRGLSRYKFDRVFTELERLGYGLVGRDPEGNLLSFLPEVSLKYIGMTAQPVLKPIEEQQNVLVNKISSVTGLKPNHSGNNLVTVVFKVDGRDCKVELPVDLLPQFAAIIKSH